MFTITAWHTALIAIDVQMVQHEVCWCDLYPSMHEEDEPQRCNICRSWPAAEAWLNDRYEATLVA